MSEKIRIALDMAGGDNAPDVCLRGAKLALEEDSKIEILAVGRPEVVDALSQENERITAVHATEIIEMGDHPVDAIRSKKDSSIVVGAKLVKFGEADGFFSAGSTGACLAAATLITGRIKGVKRPAIGAVLPAYKHPVLLIDVGANADCRPEMLIQFAKMGSAYATQMMRVENPKIGLLNIGSEETKGSALAVDSFAELNRNFENFVGNCEGSDLLTGEVDVVVTDGFSGNVALKSVEGAGKYMMKVLKDAFLSGMTTKLAALLMKPQLKEMKSKLDSEAQGGSPLLGVKGAFVIGHGSSGARGIKNGILETAKTVRCDVTGCIERAMS
jgi:phosphate acyltransferase